MTITLQQADVCRALKPRPADSHKGHFGTVGILGGATGMVGAALLAGRAALKMGAGCVHIGFIDSEFPRVDTLYPELMLHNVSNLLPKPLTVIAIGCGLGSQVMTERYLLDVLHSSLPAVLDADALNLIATHRDLIDIVRQRKAATVITPHPGEAARLLQTSTAEIQQNRQQAALTLHALLGCSVVLKGAHSICINQQATVFINPTGNPAMSSAGMGDTLTGMIAGFIAQQLTVDEALLLAVYLHGAAGDALQQQGLQRGITASDVAEQARILLNQWTVLTQ